MYCKLHSANGSSVLACADSELIGKTLKENKIEVTITKSFYMGKKTSKKEFEKLIQKAGSVNLFGPKCTGIALKDGFINEKDIIRINGIAHVQIYKI